MTDFELRLSLAAELANKPHQRLSAAELLATLDSEESLTSLLAEEVCKQRGIQVVRS